MVGASTSTTEDLQKECRGGGGGGVGGGPCVPTYDHSGASGIDQ